MVTRMIYVCAQNSTLASLHQPIRYHFYLNRANNQGLHSTRVVFVCVAMNWSIWFLQDNWINAVQILYNFYQC